MSEQQALEIPNKKNEKIDICFENLCYDVKIKKKVGFMKSNIIERQILKSVNGIAKSGEITAIMGASGAGKTIAEFLRRVNYTMLVEVYQLLIIFKFEYKFTVNNENYNSKIFSSFAAYVMQSDILLATLTPKECLEFAANLRLRGDQQMKEERVQKMLDEFRLNKCQNTLVGDESIKGITQGERKRTSIAVELITDPNLILLDEPTSGLDSFTAFLIIVILKKYARSGKTVLFTIHQPNADIFELFDKLMLLVDGKFIFQGDSSKALNHFEGLGFPCPQFSTPGDHFSEIMHYDYQTETYPQRCQIFYNAYEKEMAKQVLEKLKNREQSSIMKYGVVHSFWYQFHYISKRTHINQSRNQLILKGQIMQIIILGLLTIAIYWQLDEVNEINPIMNRMAALFFVTMTQFMMAMQPVMLTFPKERALFLKEQNSNMYSVSAYYFGRTVTEFPFLILFPILFSLIIYWAMGLNTYDSSRFFIFILVNILCNFSGNALGLQVGSLFGDVKVATAIAPALILPFVLFAGFQKNRNDLPKWIGWFEFLSPMKYGLEALATNDMDDTPMQTDELDPISLMGWELGVWKCIVILFGIGMFYRASAWVTLKLFVTKLQ